MPQLRSTVCIRDLRNIAKTRYIFHDLPVYAPLTLNMTDTAQISSRAQSRCTGNSPRTSSTCRAIIQHTHQQNTHVAESLHNHKKALTTWSQDSPTTCACTCTVAPPLRWPRSLPRYGHPSSHHRQRQREEHLLPILAHTTAVHRWAACQSLLRVHDHWLPIFDRRALRHPQPDRQDGHSVSQRIAPSCTTA